MAAAGDRGALSPDTSSESTATSPESAAEEGPPRRTVVRTAVLVLVVALVIGGLAAVTGLVVPRVVEGGEPEQVREVLQRTEDFAVTYNTYAVAEKDDYQERMRDLLTTEYYEEFVTITDAVFDALGSNDQTSGDARVLASAVQTIDEDSAVALVAVNASVATDAEEAAVERRFRWKVTLQREDGQWRVSQFEQVAPVQAELGEPGEQGGLLPEGSDSEDGNPDEPGADQPGADEPAPQEDE
ncbi:hypothetical protein GCM10009821_12570 [Aeromicrobium halocynthiae]|uniref:Mce-associated membrane protein n=1 Tax=Aeromicrobium halocynthiae TaxID=560557 RepID=A0ABN2VW50_9ACTN